MLPNDLDVVFISAFTQASALAYALAKLFRKEKTRTIIGGPHAKSFPKDCLRFFDLVVKDCDKVLIEDILKNRFDPPMIVSSDRPLLDVPTVEERLPEISKAAFVRGRPGLTSCASLLSSVGCPYLCDFCTDWNKDYIPLSLERLEADLKFLAENFPEVMVMYHDPNFAVRFDEIMQVLESLPKKGRNRYLMESSLSILKPSRLHRLRETNCAYIAPGIESWLDYSSKAGTGAKTGREKLEQVVSHFKLLREFVVDSQANFIFGVDVDKGREPAELTKDFIRSLPNVWSTVHIPMPFGETPLFENLMAEGRVLTAMPFSFYYQPYVVTVMKNYSPVEFYEHLIDMYSLIGDKVTLAKRFLSESPVALKVVYMVRTFYLRQDLKEMRRIRDMLKTNSEFRKFHEGRSNRLPEFYQKVLQNKLGDFAELISRQDQIPVLH